MNTRHVYPFVAVYGFKRQTDGFTFLLPGKEITIEGADEVLPLLLVQCNGFNSTEKIAHSVSISTGYEIREVEGLIQTLFKRRILVDALEYYETFHAISANPMPFFRGVSDEEIAVMLHSKSHLAQPQHGQPTQLEALLGLRASTREFSGESLSQEEFLRLAWSMYGKTTRSETSPNSTIGLGTVPSGGALYPLRLYGIALRVSSLPENIVCKFNTQGIAYLSSVKPEELLPAFGGQPIQFDIEHAAAIFVLVCDFKQTTEKYSNRGYRYALLETGHAAQNAYLWCAEQELGVVEIGGFNDEELAKILHIPYPKQAPIITLIVGRRKSWHRNGSP